jgi:hypothetical protein
MIACAICAGCVLTPVAAACSFMATRLHIANREGDNRGAAILIAFFNSITALVAGFLTVGIVIGFLLWLFSPTIFR